MLDDLDKFPSIGWDFDETLIGHHNSLNIQQYILANPKKKHYIITFRTHGLQNEVWQDLADNSYGLINKDNFSGLFSIDDAAWEAYQHVSMLKKSKLKYGPSEAEIYYKSWKAMTCRNHNIPVLVDDRKEDVLLGCREYDIFYYHPNDFYA